MLLVFKEVVIMEDTTKEYIIPFETYAYLKWVGLIACPAVATFLGVVGPAWHISLDSWVTTINATGLLIGALLGYSQGTAIDVNIKKEGNNVVKNS